MMVEDNNPICVLHCFLHSGHQLQLMSLHDQICLLWAYRLRFPGHHPRDHSDQKCRPQHRNHHPRGLSIEVRLSRILLPFRSANTAWNAMFGGRSSAPRRERRGKHQQGHEVHGRQLGQRRQHDEQQQ